MKLRPHKSGSIGREDRGYEFWCQGCAKTHYVPTWASTRSNRGAPVYEFNGDIDSPTFRPPITTMHTAGEWIDDGLQGKLWIPMTRPVPYCVVTVTNGKLRYSRDCGHYLAGHTTPMHDVPATREDRTDRTQLARQMNQQHQRNTTRALCVAGTGISLGEFVSTAPV